MARYFLPTIRYPLRQRNSEAAHRARHQLCVCDGRHHVDVGQIRDNLEIKSYILPPMARAFTIWMAI